MTPNRHFVVGASSIMEPVSRTFQYRKVMKPMLERKRRARINKCLDELKDLLSGALLTDSDNVAKLEKADILELTVRHLHQLRNKSLLNIRSGNISIDKFWQGFQLCTTEASQFLIKFDSTESAELLRNIPGFVESIQHLSFSQRNTLSRSPSELVVGGLQSPEIMAVWRPW